MPPHLCPRLTHSPIAFVLTLVILLFGASCVDFFEEDERCDYDSAANEARVCSDQVPSQQRCQCGDICFSDSDCHLDEKCAFIEGRDHGVCVDEHWHQQASSGSSSSGGGGTGSDCPTIDGSCLSFVSGEHASCLGHPAEFGYEVTVQNVCNEPVTGVFCFPNHQSGGWQRQVLTWGTVAPGATEPVNSCSTDPYNAADLHYWVVPEGVSLNGCRDALECGSF